MLHVPSATFRRRFIGSTGREPSAMFGQDIAKVVTTGHDDDHSKRDICVSATHTETYRRDDDLGRPSSIHADRQGSGFTRL